MIFLARFALLPLSLLTSLASATCYYPNGDSDAGHSPCDPTAEVSVCCAAGFQCLSNGLCADYRYPNWQRILRGGCTDQSWGKECGTVCKDVWPQGDEAVTYCGDGKYCCDGDDCCNKDASSALLSLGEPTIIATAKTMSSTRTLVSSQSSTTAAQATTSPTGGEAMYKGSKNTVAIGVGVGVAVGACLFAGLLAACFFIQRKKRMQRQHNAVPGITERDIGSSTVNPFANTEYTHEPRSRDRLPIPGQTTGVVKNTRKSWGRLGGGRNRKSGSQELADGNVMELSGEKVHELPAERDPGEVHGQDRELSKVERAIGHGMSDMRPQGYR